MEQEVNERLNFEHMFKDPAILRRTMISAGLLTRQNDGTDDVQRGMSVALGCAFFVHLAVSR